MDPGIKQTLAASSQGQVYASQDTTFVPSSEQPVNSTSVLRKRRELRYSREEEALSKRLGRCSDEAPIQDLQIRMLEQAGSLLKSRISEIQQRLADVRIRLTEGTSDDELYESLLRQRWLEEQKLTTALEEDRKITEEVTELSTRRFQALHPIAESSARSSQTTKIGTNLNAFLQSTTSIHPFESFAPRSASGKSYARRSGKPTLRNSISVTYRSSPYMVHSRSKSLGEKAPMGRLHHVSVGTVRHTQPYNLPQDIAKEPSSRPDPLNHNETSDFAVPAVDEFYNSFSTRVMPPPRPRPKRQSSIRSLQITTQQASNGVRPRITLPKKGEGEFGSVAIFSAPAPQLNASDLAQKLPDVQLPSYVQNLMEELAQDTAPPLEFKLGESEILTFKEPVPLSSILETPSTPSTPKKVPEQLPPSPSTTPQQSPQKKKRSIFTLHLPLRAMPGSPSRSTLAASSSTASVSEVGRDGSSQIKQKRGSPFKLRKKGLPSTRMRDLALIGAAPDDIPETPTRVATAMDEPATPRKGKVTSPVAALREVRSRLPFFGR